MTAGCVLGLMLALTTADDGPALRRFEAAETHMGSPFQLVLYCADDATARRASRAAFDRIAALDRALSDYDPDSELSRLGDRAGGPPVPASDDLLDVLSTALAMAERSGGAFDPTINPVVRLWRRARRRRELPDPEALAEARARVDYRAVRIDREARTVQLTRPGLKLDLGGIAKGYAAGEALAVVRRLGIDRALVAGAGDIVMGAPPPGRDGWTVGVAPLGTDRPPSRYLVLTDAAVSTSGDAEQFVEIGGTRYSHIVDPRTGLGVVDRSGVTVVARDGATADSLATAVSVLGPARGLALVESIDGAAALIVRSTPAGPQVIASRRFPALPTTAPEPDAPRLPAPSP